MYRMGLNDYNSIPLLRIFGLKSERLPLENQVGFIRDVTSKMHRTVSLCMLSELLSLKPYRPGKPRLLKTALVVKL